MNYHDRPLVLVLKSFPEWILVSAVRFFCSGELFHGMKLELEGRVQPGTVDMDVIKLSVLK